MSEATLETTRPLAERTRHWRTLRTLAAHLWPPERWDLKARVLLALLALLAAKLVNVGVPLLYREAVNALGGSAAGIGWGALALATPLALIVAYGSARVLVQMFGELRDFVFARVAYHAQRTLALDTFRHLHALSLRFHLERRTGGLSRIIERGTSGIDFLLSFLTFNILPTLVEMALVTGVLFYTLSGVYAAVTLGTIGSYIVFTLVVTDWRVKYRRRMNESDEEANTRAVDSLLNYETVKYFGNEAHEHQRFDRSLARYEAAAIKSQTTLSALNVGQGVIIGAGLVAVMTLAAQGVTAGKVTVGDFVMVNAYLIQLYMPLDFLGYVYRQIKQSLIDMDKMFSLLDVPAEVQDRPGAAPLRVTRGALEFDQVSFAYEAARPILKGVGFRVAAGQTVAIVGPSGAGKSTLARLLFRFYEVGAGAIRIDGQDLRDVTQQSLRSALGIVPQDTVLFNDTIRYNIRYGRPGAGDAEVMRAARLAAIHDFISSLPQGYDTMVGERGLKLSGGEKQRVAIARTILKDPPILVLDEATSALDTQKEQEIQDALRQIAANRTTLVIAHRLSTVAEADLILVLMEGRIVEQGRHDALLARDGVYARMWQRQQELQVDERQVLRAEVG